MTLLLSLLISRHPWWRSASREDYLKPLGVAPYTLARHIGIPRTHVERIAREETPVTADTASRLARVLGTTPEFWLNMQARFDLKSAEDAIEPSWSKLSTIAQVAEALRAVGDFEARIEKPRHAIKDRKASPGRKRGSASALSHHH